MELYDMDMDPEEAMFLSVIYSFHAAAMQQMGKTASPFTGEIERNLGAARGAIDTLIVLQKRTGGNLTDREDRALKALIQELQLNYVDEVKRDEEVAGEPAGVEVGEREETPTESKAEAPEDVEVAWLDSDKREEKKPGEEPAAETPKVG